MQTFEDVRGVHLSQSVTLHLHVVTREAILVAAADTSDHDIVELDARLQLEGEIMFLLYNLLRHSLIADVRYADRLLLGKAYAKLAIKVCDASTGTLVLTRTISDEHRGTDEGVSCHLVEHCSRDVDPHLVSLFVLSIGFHDNVSYALVSYLDILITDEFAQHLIQRFVLHGKIRGTIDIPERHIL